MKKPCVTGLSTRAFYRHFRSKDELVLEGEHHLVETQATETVHKVRRAGFTGKRQRPSREAKEPVQPPSRRTVERRARSSHPPSPG